MRILSMTATFGKLSHTTVQLEPGLNIIEAPNEWGKSTWCAFILAMLYGIDSTARSRKDFLPDKQHYVPWSGEPISGRMDILWKDRKITLERKNKGKVLFGDCRAYETESGLAVRELTQANWGEVLLGIDRSVFERSGFLRFSDLPVTADESLRSRLNSLVTVGDEGVTEANLEDTLKKLKNKVRHNLTGLIPDAEQQKQQLEDKIQKREILHGEICRLQEAQQAERSQLKALENHKKALAYKDYLRMKERIHQMKCQKEELSRKIADFGVRPEGNIRDLEQVLEKTADFSSRWEKLQLEASTLPPMPPVPSESGAAVSPQQAAQDAQDYEKLMKPTKKPTAVIPAAGIVGLLAGGLCLGFENLNIWGIVLLLLGTGLLFWGLFRFQIFVHGRKEKELEARMIAGKYGNLESGCWEAEAEKNAEIRKQYEQKVKNAADAASALEQKMQTCHREENAFTKGKSLRELERETKEKLDRLRKFHMLEREQEEISRNLETLEELCRDTEKPGPDSLHLSSEETDGELQRVQEELVRLEGLLGQYEGKISSLGSSAELHRQHDEVLRRLQKLEQTEQALELALNVHRKATEELQRRFAPRISKRAQEILEALTEGKYTRVVLDKELCIQSAATNENTMRSPLWRSDGTADQLYLALRLAVAEELSPEAPLILDDALIRFDDRRLSAALKILSSLSEKKQILLFTCQSRENKIKNEIFMNKSRKLASLGPGF